MKTILTILLGVFALSATGQNLTANQLLEKAITYHDPNGNWETFSGLLNIELEMPDRPARFSQVQIDLPNEFFRLTMSIEGNHTTRVVDKGVCTFTLNGSDKVSEEDIKKHRGDCERSTMFKNYYTYLYGLPMKLKDPGTHIDPVVQKKTFKGKEYLVLRATYDQEVGSDIWQFYFNPTTYAMEVYQFFKGPEETTGEYILLTDEMEIGGIKMPKDRAWYYNKDNGYLGTDKLVKK
ncbi:DUF6503 family protein [uncultured Dokdonia sp.]|uniref:DUF6503 family protein n=1 Tax=uncultured Dokdonia sp. TaxID=575653 RepID=UPI0026075BC6|nr:DUF6503 family protein [uncultured Dokdonia sp.]